MPKLALSQLPPLVSAALAEAEADADPLLAQQEEPEAFALLLSALAPLPQDFISSGEQLFALVLWSAALTTGVASVAVTTVLL
jgi:hypothetical protein